MRAWSSIAAGVLTGIGCVVGLTTQAAATPRTSLFTYPVQVLPKGATEVEQYVDLFTAEVPVGDDRETQLGFKLQTELEHGLCSKWELGLYLASEQPAGGPFQFSGMKQRIRGRLADEGDWPIDVGVYLEVAELRDTLEFEERVLLARRFGDFLALANVKLEEAVPLAGGEVEIEFAPSIGLSYAVEPRVALGIEWWMETELEGAATALHYLGPTIMWATGELSMSLGAYYKLAGEDTQSDFWTRLLVGVDL